MYKTGRSIRVISLLVAIMSLGILLIGCTSKDKEDNIAVQSNEKADGKEHNESEIIESKKGGVVYLLPGMDEVEVKQDILYKTDEDIELSLDVYYPLDKNKDHTVILIHGTTSDREFKSRKYFTTWGKLIAASGNAAVTFNWRSYSNPEDISDLIKYVRENGDKLNINKESISIVAFSGGVENGVNEAVSVDSGFIDSIVAYYGKMPMEILEKDIEKLPPIFMAEAGKDYVVGTDANEGFLNRAKELDINITKALHAEGKHGFDVLNDDKVSQEIIKTSLEFIKEHSKN